MKNFLVIMWGTETLEYKISATSTADAVAQLEREFAEGCNGGSDWEDTQQAAIIPMTEVLTLPIGNWKRKYVKPQSS